MSSPLICQQANDTHDFARTEDLMESNAFSGGYFQHHENYFEHAIRPSRAKITMKSGWSNRGLCRHGEFGGLPTNNNRVGDQQCKKARQQHWRNKPFSKIELGDVGHVTAFLG
jgi:hypothetical protein